MQQSNTEDKSRPFFSIIIPCYNTKPEHIQTLLSSIEKQYLNDDIEIDDGQWLDRSIMGLSG